MEQTHTTLLQKTHTHHCSLRDRLTAERKEEEAAVSTTMPARFCRQNKTTLNLKTKQKLFFHYIKSET